MSLWLVNVGLRAGLTILALAGLIALAGPIARAAEMPDPMIENDGMPDSDSDQTIAERRTLMILGVSWQPGYCETRPKAKECKTQSADRADARQFSLHGLWWMKKSYCGVNAELKARDKSRKWLELPELALDDQVKAELASAMPGMASGLERHEWVMHGTCSGDLANRYYQRSLALLAAVNGSQVRTLFADNIGKELGQAEIVAAFDQAFGPGSGSKVKMRCRRVGERQVITGLTIGLGDMDDGGDDLGQMIAAAAPTRFGCGEGVVDRAGLQ
jgi:ribonuclease T2